MNKKNKNIRTIVIYLAVLLVLAWGVAMQLRGGGMGADNLSPVKLTTGQFVKAAQEGRIKSVVYKSEDGSLRGEFWQKKTGKTTESKTRKFTSTWAGGDSFTDFAQKSLKGAFTIDNKGPSIWITVLTSLVPTLLIVGMMIFFLNQMQGGGQGVMKFGRARAKRNDKDKDKVTFADVAGCNEALEELGEVRDFLSEPKRFEELGARIPKGVLLVGPPGTGKTLLARAVAGEADVPFFSISGSDFVEMFVGVGASRVRDLFEQAKAEAPAIIFMDEIDAVGRQRGTGLGGGHDEREQTLNALLVEMDGFEMQDNVILLAATNRPDVLDPALLRPGRFDRQIVVDRPDLKGREEILAIHAKNKPLIEPSDTKYDEEGSQEEAVDLTVIARRTPGFTGADLRNLLNEAALLAARRGKKKISMSDVEEGIDRVLMGPERRSRLISEKEKSTIAYHESGHAIVGHFLPNADPIHKVTIIPRGGSLGSTWHLPTEDRFLESKMEMLDDIAVLLSGRAAEQLTSGDITTGASNDIERASKIAKDMVTRFGMSERLGPQAFGEQNDAVFLGRDFSNNADYADETAAVIDGEISRIINEGFERATSILTRENNLLQRMANALLEQETLEGDELKALFASGNGNGDDDMSNAVVDEPVVNESIHG